MIRFASPEILQWLWLIPVLAVVAILFERRGRSKLKREFGDKAANFLSSSVSTRKRRIKLALKLLALACFILALARPQMGKSLQEVKARGIELIIAVDVSNSMLTEDIKPSRLEAAKSELMRLVDLLPGNRVGLIAFAGSAALISPLTTDTSSLKMFIESLSIHSVGTQGTNVAGAIQEAKDAFERGGIESDEQTHVTKVLLIVSDGEDHEEGALKLAKQYANEGMRIFTIAFGTERGGPIPVRDERGFLSGYKRDKSGQNVISQVRGNFLRELAQAGHGSFHHAGTFGGMEAKRVKEDLDKLEKAEFASSLAVNYDERFQIPLLIGILLAFIDWLIGERRRVGRIWKGRFEVTEP